MIKLMQQFVEELDRYPVEDGISHPAEVTLQKILDTEGVTHAQIGVFVAYWTGCWWDSSAYRLAQMIRVVGRNESLQYYDVLCEMLPIALKHPSTEVRDAVVRTIEHWELKEAVPWLRDAAYVESTSWLKDYMSRVIEILDPTVRVPKIQPVYLVFSQSEISKFTWHFTDIFSTLDAAKKRLELPADNPGWVKEGTGWKAYDGFATWFILERYIEH